MAKRKKKNKKRKVKKAPVRHKQDKLLELIYRPKIRVVGIGGGAGSIISEISRSLKRPHFAAADTDIRALKRHHSVSCFYFGQNFTHGLGTGGNLDAAKEAAEKEKEKILKIFKGQDIAILVACLGGGVGSGAAPVFAEIARQAKNIVLGIFTLPFKFEGGRRQKTAKDSLKLLRNSLNASLAISNERIFKIIDNKTPINQALSVVNKNLIGALESLIEIIYNPGVINIDFADLRTILKGKGKIAFINTVEAEGKNAAEEIVKNILQNPLYACSLAPEKILYNIAGGKNLSMQNVEKISRAIASFNPRAKIIFGVSAVPSYKNKIKTTILITGSGNFSSVQAISPLLETKSEDKKERKVSKKAGQKAQKKKIKAKLAKKEEKQTKPRRTALEVKEVRELEEDKKLNQEKEWEIPAFLRKIY